MTSNWTEVSPGVWTKPVPTKEEIQKILDADPSLAASIKKLQDDFLEIDIEATQRTLNRMQSLGSVYPPEKIADVQNRLDNLLAQKAANVEK